MPIVCIVGDPILSRLFDPMDEQVKVDCRNCGTTLKLKASLAGKTVRCPRCKQPFVVELRATREPTDEEGPADPDDQFVAAFAHFTNCEFGGIAWGVGALTGIGMHIGGQGYGDSRSGWIAVGMALFSIVMGRFVTFLLFSGDMVDSLDLALGFFFTPLALIWGGLAGFTAYRIGSGSQFD